jgi:hypothetical protein
MKTMARSKQAVQLSLDVKFYSVRTANADVVVQAPSRSAAKYRAFKFAQEAGYYCYDGGFLAFVSGGVRVKEKRHD